MSCLSSILAGRLSCGQRERDKCINEIINAATNLGFFQVTNHGISKEVLKNMIYEQKNAFHQPFWKKVKDSFLNLSTNSYRWGNSKATRLSQFSWSEAFHIAITDIPGIKNNTLRYFCIKFVVFINFIWIRVLISLLSFLSVD